MSPTISEVREKKREQQKRVVAKRKVAGKCAACGKRAPARGHTMCIPCLRRMSEASAVTRALRRGEGRCTACGELVRIPHRCDECRRAAGKRSSEKSPRAIRERAIAIGSASRMRQLGRVWASIMLLRTGRWTIAEWGDAVGIGMRSAYRLRDLLRNAGVTIDVSKERAAKQGAATPLYTIPAEPLRRLLRL